MSDRLSVPALTDYAQRYLVDRFSVLDGVARVRIGGAQVYAMRIWLDRRELAATLFTLFIVPVAYDLLARNTSSPGDTRRRLDAESGRQVN